MTMKTKAVSACTIAHQNKRYLIYGIGTDAAIWTKELYGSEWLPSEAGWISLGGGFNSVPVAVVPSWDVLADPLENEVFGRGLDNAAYSQTLDFPDAPPALPAPGAWSKIGGGFNSALDAGSFGFSPSSATQLNTVNGYAVAVTGLGTDNQPYVKVINAGLSGGLNSDWEPLGGTMIYAPVMFSSIWSNTLQIFCIGTDCHMYQMTIEASALPLKLSGWQPVGGCFLCAPAVCSWAGDINTPLRLDVVGVGMDRQMYHRGWLNGQWVDGWEGIGGGFDSTPSMVSWGENRLDIFALGTDDQMYHKWWDGNAWGPSQTDWQPLGETFISAPTAVAPAANSLHIFGLGTDGQMLHKAWNGGPDWIPPAKGWEAIGGKFQTFADAAKPSRLDLEAGITIPNGVPVGGSVHVTLFSDGTSTFSGHMHDSGFPDYTYTVICRVVDAQNRAYQFVQPATSISGTVSPGESRDSNWTLNGKAEPAIAENWDSFFSVCGGVTLQYWAQVNMDTFTLLLSIGTAGLSSVLNVTFG